MVEVDGTQVTLENLATMMAIEAEIDRVRETYFSGETPDLTEEQQAALESLANQLETQGITLYNPDALTFPSGVDHGARVSVQVSGTGVTANTDGSVTVPNSAATLTATFSLAAAAKTDVTFQVRTLDGSAVKGTNYTAVEKTVTIPTGETSVTAEIPLLKEDNTWTNDNLWSGDKVFYLQANNITGALFAGDTHSLTQAVRIQDTSISADSFLTSVDTYAYDSGSDVDVWTKIPGEYSFEVYHDDEKYFLKHSYVDRPQRQLGKDTRRPHRRPAPGGNHLRLHLCNPRDSGGRGQLSLLNGAGVPAHHNGPGRPARHRAVVQQPHREEPG